MAAVLVDSNVLLDLTTQHSRCSQGSERALQEAAETAPLVINPLIFARRESAGHRKTTNSMELLDR